MHLEPWTPHLYQLNVQISLNNGVNFFSPNNHQTRAVSTESIPRRTRSAFENPLSKAKLSLDKLQGRSLFPVLCLCIIGPHMIKVRRIIGRDMHSRKNNDGLIQTMSLSKQSLFSLYTIKTDPRFHGTEPLNTLNCVTWG